MDNLSHTLVGAALGEAGLKRRTGLGMATLLIAANLPDLDVLAIPFGDSLAFRRGWTHGPLALVALPLLLTGAMLLWERVRSRRTARPPGGIPVRPAQLLLLAGIGVLSHPFFDWLNSYGIRLLMPFSHEWFYGDALFIIDPGIWAALGLGVYLSGRRGRQGAPAVHRPARVALGAVAAYIALMVAGSRSAERVALRAIEAQQRGPVHRLMAGPAPVNPLRRRLIYDVGDSYVFGSLVWTPRPEVTLDPEPLPKQQNHPAVHQAMRHPPIEGFLYWSRFPFFGIDEHRDRFEVHVNDARFSREVRGGWAGRSVAVTRSQVGR